MGKSAVILAFMRQTIKLNITNTNSTGVQEESASVLQSWLACKVVAAGGIVGIFRNVSV